LHLLRGTINAPDADIDIEWQGLGPLPDWPE
jgi:hypothetical protein